MSTACLRNDEELSRSFRYYYFIHTYACVRVNADNLFPLRAVLRARV